MDAASACDRYIYTTLSAWAPLTPLVPGGIWEESTVPGVVTADHIAYTMQSGNADIAIGNVPYMSRMVYLIKGVLSMTAPGNPFARGGDIMEEVYRAMLRGIGVQIVPEGPFIHGSIPRSYIRFADPPEAPKFLHYGRLFEIQTGGEPF